MLHSPLGICIDLCVQVGVSYWPEILLSADVAGMTLLRRYLSDRGVPLASAQVQYSLLSKGPDQEATVQLARDLDIAVIAYSPLGLGANRGPVCT